MAIRKPLVIVNGQVQQLSSNDVLIGMNVFNFESLINLFPDFGNICINAPFSNEQKPVYIIDCIDYNETIDLGEL